MEDDDIYDVVTESDRGDKIITPRRNKRGRPTKAGGFKYAQIGRNADDFGTIGERKN